MFQQHQGESLSEAWTRFKDLLQKVPHHGIDLWIQIQIFYDHINPITRRTIDQAASGKLRNKNDEESWVLLKDLALNDNESWNDPRDFAKPVKAISMPHDVPSTSDRRMLELEDQIKYLMRKPKSISTQPPPYQANVDEGEKNEQIIDKNMVELNNDVNNPVETSDETLRKATKESIREERKMAELPEPQPVSFYLNHKINEKINRGLIGNLRFNDSLLAMETKKIECKDYHSLL
ncbi:hypothetical protein Tco_0575179 [Tanacetum coccineum]